MLEVRAIGGYQSIAWSKDNVSICPPSSAASVENYGLAFFNQVLYRKMTSEKDYGRYKAEYIGIEGRTEFFVVKPGKYN